MPVVKRKLSKTFRNFFDSEKSGGILLIVCTAVSLLITNSAAGESYLGLWHAYVGPLSLEHWINDALMAVFFLFIGLELERELYVGELSDFRNALLPIVAALGGIAAPALIHFALNAGTPTQAGVGIPMATDIAFALGVLALSPTSPSPAGRRSSTPRKWPSCSRRWWPERPASSGSNCSAVRWPATTTWTRWISR